MYMYLSNTQVIQKHNIIHTYKRLLYLLSLLHPILDKTMTESIRNAQVLKTRLFFLKKQI